MAKILVEIGKIRDALIKAGFYNNTKLEDLRIKGNGIYIEIEGTYVKPKFNRVKPIKELVKTTKEMENREISCKKCGLELATISHADLCDDCGGKEEEDEESNGSI